MLRIGEQPRGSSTCVSLWLLLCIALFGCAPTINARVLKPSEISLGNYTNVAVAEFEGTRGNDIGRGIEQALMQARVGGEPYFKLVARDQLQKVMREQSLQLTGAIDPSQVSQVGKVLGVQGIITGNVSSYDSNDQNTTESRTDSYQCGNQTCSREVQVSCTIREVYVAFNVNFISVETGAIEVSDAEEGRLSGKRCNEPNWASALGASIVDMALVYGPLEPKEVMLSKAANLGIATFVRKITPNYAVLRIPLQKDDDDAPWFFATDEQKLFGEKMKSGVQFAQSGVWDKAIESWEDASKQQPNCAACHYNVGVGYEMKGDLARAQQQFEKALSMKPGVSTYVDAVGRVRVRQADAEKLKHQMQGRGMRNQ